MSTPPTPAELLTAQRIAGCKALLAGAMSWLGEVDPRGHSWSDQRQVELVVRAIQSMKALVSLAEQRLWVATYAQARVLLEDCAVAHWMLEHPDVSALEKRWSEHLDASRLGDYEAQVALGLEVDAQAVEWHEGQDEAYLTEVGHRHRLGSNHWTGKSVGALTTGAKAHHLTRDDWEARTELLDATRQRMYLITNLGLHHSPAASQNWFAPPAELMPDALRAGWLVFGLHVVIALEQFAREHLDALDATLATHRAAFVTD